MVEILVALNTFITTELRREGDANELCHFINSLRKKLGLNINDRIVLYFDSDDDDLIETICLLEKSILNETLSTELHIIPLNRNIEYHDFLFSGVEEGFAPHKHIQHKIRVGILT